MRNKEEYYRYLQQRKALPRRNYYQLSLQEKQQIQQDSRGQKPRLLLHACCAVCMGWPLEFLLDTFAVDIFYYNPNIWPQAEYQRRLEEVRRVLQEEYPGQIQLIAGPYDNAAYTVEQLAPYKDDPEGYRRCFLCYALRLQEAFRYAAEHDYPYLTTTLTVSRQKDSQKINEIAAGLQRQYPQVHYFYSDFKKAGGQQKTDELAARRRLYRQDYCGCVYSWEERFLEK